MDLVDQMLYYTHINDLQNENLDANLPEMTSCQLSLVI